MTSIEHIRDVTRELADKDARDVCATIIDEVASRIVSKRLGLWTYQTFSRWTKKSPTDDVLNMCVQLLVGREDARLLEMHFMYFDPSDPDSPGVQIGDEDVRSAMMSGVLVDPQTGREVEGFSEALVPYFSPSKDLVS
ncbi:hypothetical protein [Rhodanobacter sp. Soil772]|uniref:hypothetical protein n=1 Tax=Rhodanobacter sp. Soil772 TaxID=1736406 RepID=UPI0012FCED2E|nr:hypothetical protein [Rhodanobacter sp. Soil772]